MDVEVIARDESVSMLASLACPMVMRVYPSRRFLKKTKSRIFELM